MNDAQRRLIRRLEALADRGDKLSADTIATMREARQADLSTQQIADALRVARQTVTNRLNRANGASHER